MSEHQYYEFVAIDRPLTKKEMADLRACSSRATITATSFVNEYNWGDLRADPSEWMRRYFDAFVYTANWGSRRLALRLPHAAIDKATLERFATGPLLTIDDSGTHWIINWSLDENEDYDFIDMGGGHDLMASLTPLRDELLRGDLRPLYLGWLAAVNAGEVDDNSLEPEVPPGLTQLSAAQEALAEFLEIDPDLVAGAATGSREIEDDQHEIDSANAWVATLSRTEIETVFNLLLQGASHQAERQAKSDFFAWLRKSGSRKGPSVKPRKVAELWALAEEAERQRLEEETKEQARQEAERRKQHESYLRLLAADFDCHWKVIDQQAERGTASGYDAAKRAIANLADAYALVSKQEAFDKALRDFMVRHAKRGALVRRLVDAGLWRD